MLSFPMYRPALKQILSGISFAFVALINTAQSAPLYWDINNSEYASGSATPVGTWNGSNTYWSTNADGAPNTNSVFVNGSDAYFSAGTDATGSYRITVAPGYTPSLTGLYFQEGHVTIAPTADITLASPNTPLNSDVEAITLTGTPVINVQNMDSTISTRILGGVGITKTGVGKITLDYSRVSGSYFNLGDSNSMIINGGTVELAGIISGDALRVGTIVINSGATFRYMAVNSIQNGVTIEVNTGGTLFVGGISDYMGTLRGSGQIVLSTSANLKLGSNNSNTFSGQISGAGSLNYVGGSGVLSLTNINSFTGSLNTGGTGTDITNTRNGTGGILIGHKRAAQYATLNPLNTNASGTSIRFGVTTDKIFVVGNLNTASDQGAVNSILLQDTGSNAITLEVGNSNANGTYSGILTGTGGLTKIGTGTLTLTGHYVTGGASTGNSYTGATTVNAATANGLSAGSAFSSSTLKLDFNNAVVAPLTNIISDSSRLSLGGGQLQIQGRNNANVSQTFNGTTLTAGASRITVTNGTGTSSTVVNLGAFATRTTNKGGLVVFTLPTGTQSATNGITTTTGNTNGILGAWASVGNDWATAVSNGTNNNIVAFTAYDSIGGSAAAPTLPSNAAANYKLDTSTTKMTLTGGGSSGTNIVTVADTTGLTVGDYITGNGIPALAKIDQILDGTRIQISANTTGGTLTNQTYYTSAGVTLGVSGGVTDVNTIQITGAGRVIDIGTGNTLRVGEAGGIWHVSGNGGTIVGTAIDSGNLTAGGAANTDGELILTGQLTINSKITNNGSGVVTVVKGTTGELILAGNNTYSGGTVINLGRVTNRNSSALGTGAVTIRPGGQLYMNASLTNDFFISGTGSGEAVVPGAIRMNGNSLTGTITLIGDAIIGQHTSSTLGNNTISGKITGDYQIGFSAGNDGGGRFNLTNTTSDFTGGININGLNGISGPLSSQNVTVRNGATEVLPNGLGKGDVILTGGATAGKYATLDLFGFNETINGLVSGGTTTANFANTRIINESTTADSTLTLGDNHATATYAGLITDGASRKISITKIGEGVQTFAGTSTYSGDTLINKGSIKTGAVNALSASSAYVLANDSTVMLDLADFSQVIKSLSGHGTVNLGTSALTPAVGAILTTGDSADTVYQGVIVGAGGLKKQGSGTFSITGTNTYLGTTQITAGNLQVGVSNVGQTGSGAVTVDATAVLSGTGQVRGATTVSGLVRPGDSGGTNIGKLTFTDVSVASLVLASGGTSVAPRAELTLGGATGNEANPSDGIQTNAYLSGNTGNHDHISVYGTLTLNAGSVIKVNVQSGYLMEWGDVFNLFDWGMVSGAALVNNGFNVNTDLVLETTAQMTANGWSWQRDQFLSDGIIYLAPEPGRPVLILLGLALIISRRKRPPIRRNVP